MTDERWESRLMPHHRSRFVLLCQQAFAFTAVLAVGASAAGVVSLEIVSPAPSGAAAPAGTGASAQPVSLVAAEPVEPTVRTVPLSTRDGAARALPGARRGTGGGAPVVLSPPLPVTGFGTVGVTWDGRAEVPDESVTVSVRTQRDGAWSGWQPMPYDEEHAADPAELRRGRPGTDAVVVGEVEAVQVKVTAADGAPPRDLALAIVDPGEPREVRRESPAIDTGEPATGDARTVAAGTSEVTERPKIFSRRQWGADEGLRDRGSLRYGEIHAGFVHHTVNANEYSRSDVPAILRGIYAYHTQSRGWSDVGYNFLVDRFGRIWEGRAGGVTRPVVGAHTLGYNDYSFAMSAIGNFETARPSAAVLDAYGRLLAWKLSLHGVDASARRQSVGSSVFPAINGHRDAGSTACPGQYLYAKLPRIRRLAEQYQSSWSGRELDQDISGSPYPDLVVRDESTQRAYVVRTGGQLRYLSGRKALGGLSGADLLVAGGDLDGDSRPDVLVRDGRTGETALRPGTGAGRFSAATVTTDRFARMDQLTGVGDWNGDGHGDLVGRSSATGKLHLFPGRGTGRFRAATTLASDWTRYDLTAGVGDFDGDGRPDLVARDGNRLYLVRGTARGVAAPVALRGRWAGFDLISGRGDATNDGRPDIVARKARSKLTFVYPGDGKGGFGVRFGGFSRFSRVGWLAVAGNIDGSRGGDILGLGGSGNLNRYSNSGRVSLGRVVDTGLNLSDSDLVLNVGDWNRDGHGDLMTRDASTGEMLLHAGNGRRGFAAPVRAAKDWRHVSLLAAAGDVTGDGRPDLMGRHDGGDIRIYPGNGRNGFRKSYVAHSPISGNRQAGVGLFDGGGAPDSVFRQSDGTVWLWPGNGPGGLMSGRQVAKGTRGYDWFLGLGDLDGDGRNDILARARRTGYLWLLPGKKDGFGKRRFVAAGFGRYDLAG